MKTNVYIAPQAKIVNIKLTGIIAGSEPEVTLGTGRQSTFDTHADNALDIWGDVLDEDEY